MFTSRKHVFGLLLVLLAWTVSGGCLALLPNVLPITPFLLQVLPSITAAVYLQRVWQWIKVPKNRVDLASIPELSRFLVSSFLVPALVIYWASALSILPVLYALERFLVETTNRFEPIHTLIILACPWPYISLGSTYLADIFTKVLTGKTNWKLELIYGIGCVPFASAPAIAFVAISFLNEFASFCVLIVIILGAASALLTPRFIRIACDRPFLTN